jgi:hypothetical protein
MNSEMKRNWRKQSMAYCKIISQNFPGGTEEIQETLRIADILAEIRTGCSPNTSQLHYCLM